MLNELLTAIVGGIQAYAWHILLGGLIFFALELVLPASRFSLVSRVRAVGFWTAYILITVSVVTLFATFAVKAGVKPLISINAGWLAAILLATLAADFLYYWFHRMQHAVPLLWRFHAVHHSLREMSAINSAHHFTEEIFRIPTVILPLMLVDFGMAGVPAIVATIFAIHPSFTHSCTKLHLGPLRHLIADNRFHRIHHSMKPEHRDRNFGSFTSLWDTMFGTAVWPRRGEWPETGIDEHGEATTMREYLLRPFRHG